MNWIKSNPFVATLAAITLVICGALYFVGSQGAKKYEEAKSSFDESYQAVQKAENIPLYPKADLRNGKSKALTEYGVAIEDLRTLFDGYRPGDLKNVSPQDFTASLKQANNEVTDALEAAGCKIPEGFLMGFEHYVYDLAKEKATGVLNYQLEGVKHALLQLAESRPSELLNVFREGIPEENDAEPDIGSKDVIRQFGYEVAFKGSESSIREFVSSLGKTEPYYYIVRCMKVENERDDPPQVSDAKFETASALEPAAAAAVDDQFGSPFVLPGVEEEVPAEEEEAIVVEPVDSADSGRILAQVLGSEEIIVFIRFDLTMFLAAKELPKP
ncbi:MAG: hypothetical protein IZT59_09045 [Verrucomicrobia bacterium]|jgi:hypothetical protein|nr:hypothetical protein [Verrucomicrobiota bacterium]|tara:strand:+ start:15130 stop:16116 length:987 start_codon:yes stop_codon:yes gene_type:complete